jgi:UDP-N-acetylglucosamine--N-acetylmuramyl-(pentapeptide) pyrophosphoryl-undecaprenol N-acetylglucosamine transferase
MSKTLKVIVSGGGTGGHIFPAVAIANAIQDKYPQAQILFVGAKGKMEMEKVPKAGYPIKGLWISGLQRSLSLGNLLFPFKVIHSLYKSIQIIKEFKPHIAIGVGGFASGPLLQAAVWKRIPTLIHESNSYPGITNKILGKYVQKICVAFPNMDKYFPKDKLVITGNPVRKELVNTENKKHQATDFFKLDTQKPCILVIGGSQGARSINLAVDAALEKLVELGYQLIWQTGESYAATAQQRIAQINSPLLQSSAFIYQMDLAYAAADLVISRAGAMSITEIALLKKPSILVPFPFAAEDHQTKNAEALVQNKSAVLVKDGEVNEKLLPEITRLLNHTEELKNMESALEKFKVDNASDLIVKEVEVLLNTYFGDFN